MRVIEDLVSVQEAADILNLDRSRIGKLCRQGRFEGARKIGERWVIPRESVNNFQRLPRGGRKNTKIFLTKVIQEANEWKEDNNND